MRHNLRRKVSWGPTVSRKSLPFGLARSLRANQAFFNIDSHWEAIHHTLYPAFIKGDNLYLSAQINTEKRVSNHSVATFLTFLDEIEVISKEADGKLKSEKFDEVFHEYANNDKLTTTTKAEFHSPGEIWNAISGVISIDGD